MTPEEALRVILETVLAMDAPRGHTTRRRSPKASREARRNLSPSPPASRPIQMEIIPAEGVPTPAFDHVEVNTQTPLAERAGFQNISDQFQNALNLREMEDAVTKLTRGNGVPPGMYDPDDPAGPERPSWLGPAQ